MARRKPPKLHGEAPTGHWRSSTLFGSLQRIIGDLRRLLGSLRRTLGSFQRAIAPSNTSSKAFNGPLEIFGASWKLPTARRHFRRLFEDFDEPSKASTRRRDFQRPMGRNRRPIEDFR